MPASTRSSRDTPLVPDRTPLRRTAKVCKTPVPKPGKGKQIACGSTPSSANKRRKYVQTVDPFPEGFDPALWVPKVWKTLFEECTTKEEFRAMLKEFLMLAFWRVRHYEPPVIEKLLEFFQPRRAGVINAIDEVPAFGTMMRDLQALISFSHEVCARIWLDTPTGAEFKMAAQKLKLQKRKIPIVDFEKIEGALKLTSQELMSLWAPILPAARVDYWDERNGQAGRTIYSYMRNSSYDLIALCIGFLHGDHKAEQDISHRARQWALNEVSSQLGLTYWPERDRPLPTNPQGWAALPELFESAESNGDFKGLMARFNFRLYEEEEQELDGQGGDHTTVKDCARLQADGDRSAMRSRTLEVEGGGVEHCVSVANGKGDEAYVIVEQDEAEGNEERGIPMCVAGGEVGGRSVLGEGGEMKEGTSVDREKDEELQLLGMQKALFAQPEGERDIAEFPVPSYKGNEIMKVRERKGGFDYYGSYPEALHSGPNPVQVYEGRVGNANMVKQESEYHHEGYSQDESCTSTDTDESGDAPFDGDDEMRTITRYGGIPGTPFRSSRMDMAAATSVKESRWAYCENFDRNARNLEISFFDWIKLRLIKLHESRAARRYGAMGVLGRAAFDLAELEAMNNIYKDAIVEMVNKQSENEETMKKIENARLKALEHDKIYEETVEKARQGCREVSVARTAAQKDDDMDTMSGYLDLGGGGANLKKRKQVEAAGALLFGRQAEKMAKKLRNNRFMVGVEPKE